MMVYNTQNYWVSGLCLSLGIPNTRKHDVSETDPVSETLYFLVFGIPHNGSVQGPSTSKCVLDLFEK
jgi:hypothetical protein